MHTPNVDVSEENPDELFDAVLMTVKYVIREANIAKEDIKLISFSAQMHSLVAMDEQHHRLTEILLGLIIEQVNMQTKLINNMMVLIFIEEQVHPFIQCHHYRRYFG